MNRFTRFGTLRRLAAPPLLLAAALVVFGGGTGESSAAGPDTAAPDTAASEWAVTDHGAVRLVAGVEGVGELAEIPLGLQFRMAEGWKIYWRSPGDAGYPPAIDWSGSENLAQADIAWPAPMRFSILGFETVGYEKQVVLPIAAGLRRPGEALRLEAHVDYLTCAEICVPYTATLHLAIPAGPAVASGFADLIEAWSRRVPDSGGEVLTLATVESTADDAGMRLKVVARSPEPFTAPDIFIEGPGELAFAAPQVRLGDGGRTAVLDIAVDGGSNFGRPLAGEPLTLTLVDGARSIERKITVAPAGVETSGPRPSPAAARPFLLMLAIAWLGGLILNLMPCVLPVLSIKLLSVIGHGGGEDRVVRLGFLASAAGILATFLVLALVLLALKAAGGAVGWGLQFQQPWFLAAMTLIVTVFAANLWGLFEVPLPRLLADAGSAGTHVRGLGGQFLTGALATLLATPCSAPFVGTAVGFALSGGSAQIVLIFTAMGLGLATPYLTVAAWPSLATRLPRPGPWMGTVRRILGLALVATGLWLLSVLAAQAGSGAALIVGALAAALVVLVVFGRRLPRRWRPIAPAAGFALALAAIVMSSRGTPQATASSDARWQPFDTARVPALVAEGKTVFVNVTADWCLTCKVNERLVLDRPPVRERLAAPDVVAMQADWTRPDPAIAGYLASFGRYGIPFDAVYGPGLPDGEALPELLSGEIVIDALRRAAETGGVRRAGDP